MLAFLRNYLESKGAGAADLTRFKVLPSSTADGAQQIGRLTNLTQLTIDTSFWSRYRSITNPDLIHGKICSGGSQPKRQSTHRYPEKQR